MFDDSLTESHESPNYTYCLLFLLLYNIVIDVESGKCIGLVNVNISVRTLYDS